MLRLELLPAAHGDAIWIEYGDARAPRRIVIDGGPAPTYQRGLRSRIAAMPDGDRRIDLLVVTHIDADHIDGAILLLQEAKRLGLRIGEIWFNAWPQLDKLGPETFQPLQGEFLGGLITVDTAFRSVWNVRFGGGAVQVPESGELPVVELPDGARLTLLSPTARELRRLRARWASAIREFSPGDVGEALRRLRERREYRAPESPAVFAVRTYGDDRSVANGSSIAFLLEVEGKRLLLAADAHARVLTPALERVARASGTARLRLDAVKLPHHGSMSNVTPELLSVIESERWLVSTSGAVFDHPDEETATLIAARQPRPAVFLCNYRAPSTERLARAAGQVAERPWRTLFPGDEDAKRGPAGGLALELAAPSPAAAPAAPRRRRSARP